MTDTTARTTWTPGPWRISMVLGQKVTKRVWTIETATGDIGTARSHSDARLIAAAPQMAEALRAILSMPTAYTETDRPACPECDELAGGCEHEEAERGYRVWRETRYQGEARSILAEIEGQ